MGRVELYIVEFPGNRRGFLHIADSAEANEFTQDPFRLAGRQAQRDVDRLQRNLRLRLRVFTGESNPPIVPSLVDVWNSANWFEREAFDLYGIVYSGHPDLRRLLTDYGFIGHPFRKDFPLSGHVEMRYDPEKGRVIYQPVSIEPRVLVPRVIRHDSRYEDGANSKAGKGAHA